MAAPSRNNLEARRPPRAKAPVSTAALQIVQAAVREGVSVAELSSLAQGDPGFALRLLSAVNSAAFRRRTEVRDVQQAALLLGVRGLRNVALSLVVTDLAPMGEGSQVLLANSIRRAIASRLIGQALGHKELDGLFTVGLLLESGLLVNAREDLPGATSIAKAPALHRVVHERAAGKLPHPEMGAILASDYKLSPEIVEAILHHHDPEPPSADTSRVAWLAELAAGVFECVDIIHARAHLVTSAGKFGLSSQVIDELLDAIPREVSEAAKAFDRDIGPQHDLAKLRDDANQRLVEINLQHQEMVLALERLLEEKSELLAKLASANEALEQMAATDPLTSLANRRALEQALTRDIALAHRNATPLSLAMVDIDHFKLLNDRYGHKAGDEALKVVSRTLSQMVRLSDLAARYGGEEFAVVFPRTDAEGALVVAERIRRAIEVAEVAWEGQTIRLTASVGVATLDPNETQHTLFSRADAALYSAKRAGRNCVHLAS